MDLHLSGKVAIVTGGSAGIGLACAKALHAEGVHVVIAARDARRIEAARTSILEDGNAAEVVAVPANMAQLGDILTVVTTARDHFGKIDILINNAGAAPAGSFLTLPDETFLEAWNLKLLGYIRMVRAVAPYMIEQRDGRIVNIIGGAARTPTPLFLAGSTTNAALVNFTRGISKELATHNVRINAISPGSTATTRADRLAEQQASARSMSIEEVKTEMGKSIPLGRLVDPGEIAAMAVFLVSDLSASTTGIEIQIDGGAAPGI